MRRGYAPYFDLWTLATKGPMEEGALRTLAATHFPVSAPIQGQAPQGGTAATA